MSTELFHELWRSHGTAAIVCTQGMMDQKSMKMREVWPALMLYYLWQSRIMVMNWTLWSQRVHSNPYLMILLEKGSLGPEKSGEIPHMEVTAEPKILIQALHMRQKKIPQDPFQRESSSPLREGKDSPALSLQGMFGMTQGLLSLPATSPSSRGPIQGGNWESLGNVYSGWTLNFPPPGDKALGDYWVTVTPWEWFVTSGTKTRHQGQTESPAGRCGSQ